MLNLSKAVFLILVTGILSLGCDQKEKSKNDLILIDSYKLSITEASGLSMSSDLKSLWTVSDQNNEIYNISFKGKILSTIKVDQKDLEGITIINDSTIALIVESKNRLVLIDTDGNELDRKDVDLDNKKNSGLEGITYDKENEIYYLVSEKDPSFLFKLDKNLSIIEKHKLKFAKDYSSVFYDSGRELLWILSDESKALFKTSLDGKMIKKYDVKVPKPEGLAIDISNDTIYIVSDDTSKLYIFSLP